MKRQIVLTAALVTALSAPFAVGQDRTTPAPDQPAAPPRAVMSIVEIATMLEGQGYTLHEIELERGLYDVEMTDARGMRVEALLDAATGEVLPYRDDDDRRYGRDDD
ncbi:PepSY domain-containing protein [Oceanicola sp. 22II-s10i]|uniref:PepSY domain-containing protein n=1 Tax=Oceanicola sp. 22II-s10i TaxID=1317116 RepID=UPI000B526166|nr:PepSY domain-containing protein [Oceanicola sp. 22II-s10i]